MSQKNSGYNQSQIIYESNPELWFIGVFFFQKHLQKIPPMGFFMVKIHGFFSVPIHRSRRGPTAQDLPPSASSPIMRMQAADRLIGWGDDVEKNQNLVGWIFFDGIYNLYGIYSWYNWFMAFIVDIVDLWHL